LQLWEEIQQHSSLQKQKEGAAVIPGYPGFLTLLAFYIFVKEDVDVAVVETGLGGENDSTNIISRPSATGIASLGLDHTNVLGNDIRSIAWHKGGIFKPQAPAFTVEQEEPAMVILRQRSSERNVAGGLKIVTEDVARDFGVEVYPDMPYQRRNASLAICLAEAAIMELEPGFTMTSKHARSIERAVLPGRNEVILGENNVWLLSVAHNDISIKEASTWFRQTVTLPE
jgi:folylpolyglutamate synthase